MSQEPKKIEIVSGDGKDLEISEVSTHLSALKPKTKSENNKQEIVIPQSKKRECKNNKK